MSVTVRDLLKLERLSSAKVITGADGLDRKVSRVNFTDTPVNEEVDFDLLSKGDVFICSFYAMQNNEALLYQSIDLLILMDQDKDIMESRISRLLSGEAAASEAALVYQSAAGGGVSQYVAAHATLNGLSALRYKTLREDMETQLGVRFLQNFNGGFVLLAGDNAGLLLERIAPVLRYYDPDYSAGCSEVCVGADHLAGAFRQALSADETGRSLGVQGICYENLSVYKLLIPLRNSQVLEQFCEETLTPLRTANLLETVKTYFECDGNIEQTAERLAQHKNTIRFRINKAKRLLGLEYSHCAFVEKLSLALKGEKLLRAL